jgi:hypothetical protein
MEVSHPPERPEELLMSWLHPIPVSERLPDAIGFFLAYGYRKHWHSGVWQLASFAVRLADGACVWVRDDTNEEIEVTHWLPLPPKPEA